MRPTKLMAPRGPRHRGGSPIQHNQHFMLHGGEQVAHRGNLFPLINHIASRQLPFPDPSQPPEAWCRGGLNTRPAQRAFWEPPRPRKPRREMSYHFLLFFCCFAFPTQTRARSWHLFHRK